MIADQNGIDDQLWRLQKICNRYKTIDPLADRILYAVYRHIMTGRATKNFERSFVKLSIDNLQDLVKECLNGDKSDDGIIKTCKNFQRRKKSRTV